MGEGWKRDDKGGVEDGLWGRGGRGMMGEGWKRDDGEGWKRDDGGGVEEG